MRSSPRTGTSSRSPAATPSEQGGGGGALLAALVPSPPHPVEVGVELLDVPEDRVQVRGLGDVEYLPHWRLRVDEQYLARALLHALLGAHEDAQSSARRVLEAAQLEDQDLERRAEDLVQLALELGGRVVVEAPHQAHRLRERCTFLEVNAQGHVASPPVVRRFAADAGDSTAARISSARGRPCAAPRPPAPGPRRTS